MTSFEGESPSAESVDVIDETNVDETKVDETAADAEATVDETNVDAVSEDAEEAPAEVEAAPETDVAADAPAEDEDEDPAVALVAHRMLPFLSSCWFIVVTIQCPHVSSLQLSRGDRT